MIIDGKALAAARKEALKRKIAEQLMVSGSVPHLAIIQVGEREDSTLYIRKKKEFGEAVGVRVTHFHYPETISEAELIAAISIVNSDPETHGIIVQMPLPEHIDSFATVSAIAPEKDVDGLRTDSSFMPATTKGIMTMLAHSLPGISDEGVLTLAGKTAAVVGQSELVGKPTAKALERAGARVLTADITTTDLKAITLQADIVIVAVGKPQLITAAHVKPGQVIIDVGINIVDGKTMGDVAFDEVEPIVGAITPVPGGVGPMTVVSLFENLAEALYDR